MKNHSHGASPMRMHDVPPGTRALIGGAVVWSLAWKGFSLWRAARNGSKPWFATLLLTNTIGVLDAVYLFGVDRQHRTERMREDVLLVATGELEQQGHREET